MTVLILTRFKQVSHPAIRVVYLIVSPQPSVKAKNRTEVHVELKPTSRPKTFLFHLLEEGNFPSQRKGKKRCPNEVAFLQLPPQMS